MITLTQTERLVRKITEVVSQPASDTQMAKLAQDYAELCREANRRLEQCAIMIEAGQFLQALQLAETPPPLLDLITILNFRQAAEWRSYCQTHHLPWTEPFYDKYVRALNSSYSKGIAGNHPFYRDYRRAVMSNDDDRANSILRVIARLNPSDENTQQELKRLEEKLLRGKLENLRLALVKGDSAAAQAQVAQIETSGLAVPSTHPVWQQAQVARCQQLLRRAEKLRQEGAWQDAEVLVEEIHAFATEYNVRMPAADADSWTALETWTTENRAAYADDQDFQRAISSLDYEITTIESKRASDARPGLVEAASMLNSLAAKWNEAARLGRPVDETLTRRHQEMNDWLQQSMKAGHRRKRAITVAATLLVLGAMGAAVPSVLNWFQERDILRRLGTLESARNISGVETLLAEVPPRLKAKSPLAESLAQAQSFLVREKGLKRTFDEDLKGLDQLAAGGFRSDVEQSGARRAQAERALDQLAPEFKPAGQSALLAWDAKWQPLRNAALAERLGRAEQFTAALHGTNGYEAIHAALPRLQSALADMDAWKSEPPALDSALQARFLEATNTYALWRGRTEQWDTSQASMSNSQSLEDYLSGLAQWVLSPFANAAQRDGAAEIARRKMDQTTLLGELLLPNDQDEWNSLTNAAAWRMTRMPEKPTAQEKDTYFDLRDDKNMQDIYAYQLVAARPDSSPPTHVIFAQGSIDRLDLDHKVGLVYDPGTSPESARFARQVFYDYHYSEIKKLGRLPECDTFEHLGLGELIDPNSGNYQKAILPLLDQLNRETNASAVFRAVVALKLFALARSRPDEWGLRWSPDAAQQLQALTDLGAMTLKSGDWMLRSQVQKYEAPLQKYFKSASAVSLESQAKFLQQLVRESCLAGFAFAGFVDGNGHPVLHPTNLPARDYWGWGSQAASAIRLYRKAPGAEALDKLADPLPFTPLFVFRGDAQKLLQESAQSSSFPISQAAAILPPLFRPNP